MFTFVIGSLIMVAVAAVILMLLPTTPERVAIRVEIPEKKEE